MKFLYFTDLHLYDRDISTRNDSSSQTALNKLMFLAQLARDRAVDAVFSGGDLFSDRVDAPEYVASIIDGLSNMPSVFTVVGNHDVLYRSYQNFKKRNLAILKAAKAVRILRDDLVESHGILGISSYDEGIVESLGERAGLVRAVFAHHSIEHGRDRLVLSVDWLKKRLPNLKYIFSGHDHTEYPDMSIHGVTVIRPGSVLRTSTALENVTRAPQVLICSVEDMEWNHVSVEKVMVPHQPATAVFNLNTKTIAKSNEAQLDEFVSTLTTGSSERGEFDVEALVLAMAEETGDAELIEYVHRDLPSLLAV